MTKRHHDNLIVITIIS